MEKDDKCANDLETRKFTTVEGEKIDLEQSCAMNILADKVHMRQSAGGIIRAEKVKMEDSLAVFVYADEIEGEVKTLFTPATALIAGGAMLLAWLLWRRR